MLGMRAHDLQYPEVDVTAESLKPAATKETARSAFLEHSETQGKRLRQAWYILHSYAVTPGTLTPYTHALLIMHPFAATSCAHALIHRVLVRQSVKITCLKVLWLLCMKHCILLLNKILCIWYVLVYA